LANIPLVTIAIVATSQTAFLLGRGLAIHSQKTIFKNEKCEDQVVFEIFNSHILTKIKEKEGCLTNFTFVFSCSQIWLKFLVDHCHFGYITKLTKKTLITKFGKKEKKKKEKEKEKKKLP
jgi:hypothetical protein